MKNHIRRHGSLSETNRYYVNKPEFNNCALCIAESEGPMTQQAIGNIFGLTKMRIAQIEKKALLKLKKRLAKQLN